MDNKVLWGVAFLYIGIFFIAIYWVNNIDIKSTVYPIEPCIKTTMYNDN